MTSKQLINLAGGVLVLAIFVAALLLVALPMYSDSQRIAGQALQVKQANTVYEMQVQTLRTQAEDTEAITRTVEVLTEEVPGTAQQSDVFEIVNAAAAVAGATIDSVVPAESRVWAARIGPTDTASLADAASTDPAAVDPAVDPAADPSAQPVEGEVATEEVPVEVPAEAEIPFVIIVRIADAGQAAVFLDALSGGPRLLSVVHSTLDDDQDSLLLTVDALAYIRAQD